MRINRFADFAEEETLDGEKMKITDLLNKEIIVTGYKITESLYKKTNSTRCLKLQFSLENNKGIVFTGSDVLIDQIIKYESHIPFISTITKVDKYYSFA